MSQSTNLVFNGGSIPGTRDQSDWNENNPHADSYIKNKPDLDIFLEKNGDGKDVTVTFTEASTRTNIASTESLSTLFGKVKKFFTDLASVAFSGSYDDLTSKPNIYNGRIHRLRPISDEVIGETSNYDGWVLDLESQNESAPGGYDRLTPQRLKQILDNGEFLVMEVFQSGDYIPLALQALVDVQNENPLRIKVEFVRQYAYNNLLGFLRMAMYTPTGEESYIQMLGIGPNSSWYQDKEALAINGDGGDVTVDFTEAQTRTNIGTGEKLSVLFGKIKKWFTDLKALAFKDKADLTQDVNGVLPIANGGTNASTASYARTNLDVYSKAEVNNAIDTAVAGYISSRTTNVNQHDSNTDTSSFTFVNGHVYHLSLYFEFTALKINTSSSGTGSLVVYIGTSGNAHYSTLQAVTISGGSIQPGSFRIPIDWKASGIVDSSDNKLHLAVLFNGTMYSFVAGVSAYQFDLMGTDFDGT